MKFLIRSKVYIDKVGEATYEHEQIFDDDSNVFGRALAYREHMNRLFPNSAFELVSAKEIKAE